MPKPGEMPHRATPILSTTILDPFRGYTSTPDGETPPEGDAPPVTPPGTPPSVPPTGESSEKQDPPKWKNGEAYDPAQADQALTAARAEANRVKRERDALQAQVEAAANEKLSESERLKKENETLQAQIKAEKETVRQQRIQLAVERTARELDFVSETAAQRFLDQDQVTFDENGQPTNVKELLTAVLKAEPYLKKPAADARPQPIPAHPSGGGQVGQMTPEQQTQAQQQNSRQYQSAF